MKKTAYLWEYKFDINANIANFGIYENVDWLTRINNVHGTGIRTSAHLNWGVAKWLTSYNRSFP